MRWCDLEHCLSIHPKLLNHLTLYVHSISWKVYLGFAKGSVSGVRSSCSVILTSHYANLFSRHFWKTKCPFLPIIKNGFLRQTEADAPLCVCTVCVWVCVYLFVCLFGLVLFLCLCTICVNTSGRLLLFFACPRVCMCTFIFLSKQNKAHIHTVTVWKRNVRTPGMNSITPLKRVQGPLWKSCTRDKWFGIWHPGFSTLS